MDNIEFKSETIVSFEQLAFLFIFICVLFALSLLFKKRKAELKSFFNSSRKEQICNVTVQKLPNNAFLYKLDDEDHEYLVFRCSDGVTVVSNHSKK
ncbi:hypothetical protein [Flocculibacter collagenilyticus]|uniref:hypothetical protein n=1 Tax=Flocculibacter collagenilyticus TaxID=2744479 RepID=UPI0018F4BC09|nr:hypothetical protein [Flocculibacter collagenilyticus]